MHSNHKKLHFLLLQVINPHHHTAWALEAMSESEKLVETFGGKVKLKNTQHRVKPHPAHYIGSGKVEWVKEQVEKLEIDVVVLNDIVKSGQLFTLEKELWKVNSHIKVWDRVDLILNIFQKHATTTEAKLQIELAQIQHGGARIVGLGKDVLSRQGGGIGTRGKGETNIEFEKRLIKDRTSKIKKEIKKITRRQERQMSKRKNVGVKTMALVGYTSAGKTTLFSLLTKRKKKTSAGLFTTLESIVGTLKPRDEYDKVLISDTIGFIENLPPSLIETFKTTLMESLEADILLHVIDAADPHRDKKIEVVNTILDDLKANQNRILVFNKIDKLKKTELEKLKNNFKKNAVFISAHTGEGIEDLKEMLKIE